MTNDEIMTKPEAQKMARCIRRSTFVIPKSAIRNPMNACLEFAAVEANPADYHAEKAAHS